MLRAAPPGIRGRWFPCVFLCVRRLMGFALKPVEKEGCGEQVGGATGRYVQFDETPVERLQFDGAPRAPRRRLVPARAARRAASRRARCGPPRASTQVSSRRRHHGEQRVQARGRFAVAARARAHEFRQRDIHDVRKAGLRLSARAADVVVEARLLALVAGDRRARGDPARARSIRRARRRLAARGPTVRAPRRSRAVRAPRSRRDACSRRRSHRACALRRRVRLRRYARAARASVRVSMPARASLDERRLQRERRCAHQFPVEIVMRAAAADIDEAGLRRERDFVDQRLRPRARRNARPDPARGAAAAPR